MYMCVLVTMVINLKDLLDTEMPNLPEDHTPQDIITGVSIDIQLPTSSSDVS